MKNLLFSLLLSLLLAGCENITNVIETGDSYLPNLHWKIAGDNSYVEVDTVFGRAGEEILFRLEIYYDHTDDYRDINIGLSSFGNPTSSDNRWFSGGWDYRLETADRIESPGDTIIYSYHVHPEVFRELTIEAEIHEKNSEFDLKRFKDIIVFNQDSLQ